MPGWLTEVLKLLGFTTPFVYTAATYGLFYYADRKASGKAKAALSAWVQSGQRRRNSEEVIIDLFNKIYTDKLLSANALIRSASITLLVSSLIWFEVGDVTVGGPLVSYISGKTDFDEFRIDSIGVFTTNIFNVMSDYVSLFFIKRWLLYGRQHIVTSVFVAAIVGVGFVGTAYVCKIIIELMAYVWIFDKWEASALLAFWLDPFNLKIDLIRLAPALAVHLWLPIFGLAVVLTHTISMFARAATWMQWFIKQGQHHPFQAVGYVASVIVFASSVIIQFLWR
jgi:hypothetical protein